MPFCHFSRVYKETAWSDIKANIQFQISRNCKALEYLELITITIDQSEFELICSDISCPRPCYQKYSYHSVASSDGKWQCIVLTNKQNGQKLILYTAGRLYPLYASVCD